MQGQGGWHYASRCMVEILQKTVVPDTSLPTTIKPSITVHLPCTVAGGDVTVGFAETDFSAVEGEALSVIVTVTGNQEFGDMEFQVTALTGQQFLDQLATTCNGGIDIPDGASADCKSPTSLHTLMTRAMVG